jgi:acetyl-CoA carboxylase carboxyl transferase subunit alpha
LWRTWDYKEQAAEALKLTATDMLKAGLIDGIIKEPLGGAHTDAMAMAKTIKKTILDTLAELNQQSPEERIDTRIDKFSHMGVYKELPEKVKI